MHLNKLSTAALLRLTILAALNLIMGRVLDRDRGVGSTRRFPFLLTLPLQVRCNHRLANFGPTRHLGSRY